jgi:hypothetical protein
MKKPFAREGPESAVGISSARASAFRPLSVKGAAHSRRDGTNESGHGGDNIGARGPIVNGWTD